MSDRNLSLIASDLRSTATGLQFYLDELLANDSTLLADALRKFPGMLADIANQVAPPHGLGVPLQPWPVDMACAHEHYVVLMRRLDARKSRQ